LISDIISGSFIARVIVDIYVHENRIVMAYNFSFRTNIQFPTPYYVVLGLNNSRLIA